MKKNNNKTSNLSVSAFCSDYIHNFNARELTKSWKRNAVRAVAVAGISSAMFTTQEAKAQRPFDCPPEFFLMESKSFLENPQGLTTTPYRTNPTFVDFDGDGDFDIVAGSGGIPGGDDIVYFRNLGSNTSPNWSAPVFNPNGLDGLALFGAFGASNFAPTFADIDNDGDLDAFIGTFNNGIIYQENIGTATSPNYAAGVSNPFGINTGGALLTAPTLVDIDNDGDLDMFVGEVFNDIFFFENTGTASAPSFTARGTNLFGLDNTFQIDYLPKLSFADLDDDGDYDAMIGGYYGNFTYFENSGDATTPSFGSPQVNPFFIEGAGVARTTVSFADTDNDGDFDLVSGTDDGDYVYYENYGTATEAKYASYPFDLATPFSDTYNAVDYADMDNDGDIDLIVGNGFGSNDIFFVENISTNPSMPSFAAPVLIASIGTGFEAHPTVADIDGDGDFDILAGSSNGNFYYFQNTGSATSFNFGGAVANPFGLFDVGTYSTPEFADMDGDGDQDLFVGRKNIGGTLYFENTGSATSPAFAAPVTNPFGLISNEVGIRWSEVDIDNDGDLDFAYGDEDNTTFYLNVGTTTAPSFVNLNTNFGFDDTLESDYSPVVVDVDQDGFYEAFIGNKSDRLFVYENSAIIPEINITGPTTINTCEPVTLYATSPNAPLNDLTVSWFDANNNQLVATGTTFTYTPTEIGSASFYATAKSTITGCESTFPSATVQIACDFDVTTNLSATPGYGSAMLSWTVTKDVPNIPAEISGYEVYADFGNTGQFFLVGVASTTAYSATYEAVGLINGVETIFKVRPIFRGTGRGYGAFSNTVSVTPSIILGEEGDEAAGFAFYPNPNNGEFNLRLQDGATSAKISVVSLSGQLVYRTELTSTQSSINLGNVASGMYIVRVETANGTYQQKVSITR